MKIQLTLQKVMGADPSGRAFDDDELVVAIVLAAYLGKPEKAQVFANELAKRAVRVKRLTAATDSDASIGESIERFVRNSVTRDTVPTPPTPARKSAK